MLAPGSCLHQEVQELETRGGGGGGKMTQCSHFPCLLPLGTLSPEIKPNIPQQELGMQTSSVGMQFDYFNSRLPFSNCILFLFKKHIPIICFIRQGRFSKLTAEPSLLCYSGKPRVQSAAPNNTANPACLLPSLRLYIKKNVYECFVCNICVPGAMEVKI